MERPDMSDVAIAAMSCLFLITAAQIWAVQHGATKSREQTDLICIELRKLSLSQELLVAKLEGREPRVQPE